MTRAVLPALAALTLAAFPADGAAMELREGDIIFQREFSDQSEAIIAATHSKYTHMGIIFLDGGKPYVYEGIQPVTRTPLVDWIRRGENGHFVVKRLRADQHKNADFSALKKEAARYLGRDYDWLFGWSDERIYCSELVWKSYQRALGVELCPLRRLRDFDLGSPVVQDLMKRRYGDAVPLDMEVVAPSDIFDSKILETVPPQ